MNAIFYILKLGHRHTKQNNTLKMKDSTTHLHNIVWGGGGGLEKK